MINRDLKKVIIHSIATAVGVVIGIGMLWIIQVGVTSI